MSAGRSFPVRRSQPRKRKDPDARVFCSVSVTRGATGRRARRGVSGETRGALFATRARARVPDWRGARRGRGGREGQARRALRGAHRLHLHGLSRARPEGGAPGHDGPGRRGGGKTGEQHGGHRVRRSGGGRLRKGGGALFGMVPRQSDSENPVSAPARQVIGAIAQSRYDFSAARTSGVPFSLPTCRNLSGRI